MEINDWLVFSQIVDCGGISAASRRLGTPKSTLSRRLSKLEDDFGTRLLNRRGRSFELTDTGRLLYQEARQLMQQLSNARERLAESISEQGGTLRMTAPKAPGSEFLGIWLAAFIQQHPDIHIELDLTDQMINLFDHDYDLAFRVGPLADSTLIARKLGVSERILVAAPDYLQKHAALLQPSDLSHHQCIGFSEQRSGQGVWLLTKGKQQKRVSYYPVLRCDDMATSLRVTQSGAGVAMIPAFVCRELLKQGKLQRVLPKWAGPIAEFYLVFPDRELMPVRVRLLADFLIEQSRKDKWRLSLASQ